MMLTLPVLALLGASVVLLIVLAVAALLVAKRCADEAGEMKSVTEDAIGDVRAALSRLEDSIDRLREEQARSPVVDAADRIEDVAESLHAILDGQAETGRISSISSVTGVTPEASEGSSGAPADGDGLSGRAGEDPGSAPGSAPSTPRPGETEGTPRVISAYLAQRGFREVTGLGGGAIEVPDSDGVRISLTARREGIVYKGFARVEGGRVVDAKLSPTIGIFP